MMFIYKSLLIISCAFVNLSYGQYSPPNPCKNIFQYIYDESSTYGQIDIPNPQLRQTIKLSVELSLGARLPTKYVGSLELYYSSDKTLKLIERHAPIRYRVRFPLSYPLPKLTKITYNGHVICTGPSEVGPIVTEIRLGHTLHTEIRTIDSPRPRPIPIREIPQLQSYQQIYPDVSSTIKPQKPEQSITAEPSRPANIRPQLPSHGETPTKYRPQYKRRTTQSPSKDPILPKKQPQFSSSISPASSSSSSSTPLLPSSSTIPYDETNEICGRAHARFYNAPLIIGGTTIRKGAWPWLVAIYLNIDLSLKFQCSGNLITNKLILSAGHCFKQDDVEYKANEIIAFLGRHNISLWMEEHSVLAELQSINVHRDYMKKDGSYDADIAILVLKKSIAYSDYIRPICLWSGSNDIALVEGKEGVVIGWGRDEFGNAVTPIPKKISIPIVSERECLRSADTFNYITSKRTYCAGRRDGTGPCNGDSGGGMSIQQNDRWSLRGIISASLSDINGICNLNAFVLFTDASKFSEWITSFMNK